MSAAMDAGVARASGGRLITIDDKALRRSTRKRQGMLSFFELPNGLPAHDTFSRVLGLIAPQQFSAGLVGWTAALQQTLKGRVIAIDGKTVRGSTSKTKGLRGCTWSARGSRTRD